MSKVVNLAAFRQERENAARRAQDAEREAELRRVELLEHERYALACFAEEIGKSLPGCDERHWSDLYHASKARIREYQSMTADELLSDAVAKELDLQRWLDRREGGPGYDDRLH